MNSRTLSLASALIALLAPALASAASPIIVDQPTARFADTALGNGNTLTLTYSNGSNVTQTITNVSLIGAAPTDFATAPVGVIPLTLAPGATFRTQVAFNPTKIGLRSATVSVAVQGQQSCDSAVSGNATAAAIPGNPSPVRFGGTAIGASVKKTVTFTNMTANQITINGYSITVNNAEYTATSLFNFPAQVPAGASLPIDVTFTPNGGGIRLGVLNLTVQNVNTPVNVVLLGSSGDPQVNLGNNAVLFGNTHVGAVSDPQMLSVGNIGYTDLKVIRVLVAGANPGDFALSLPPLPASIAPGNNLTYGVTFRPMDAGSRNAAITVVTDDPNNGTVTYLVGGTGVAFSQSISPGPGMALDFGEVKTGGTSPQQAVVVTNMSMAPLNITKVVISGPQAAAFALVAPPMGNIVVKAGGTASIPLTFSPKAGGISNAVVSLLLDDPNNPVLSAAVTGTGTAGAVTVSPLQVEFGSIPLGKTSAAKAISLTNTGTSVLTLAKVAIMGADAAAFSSPDAPDVMTPLDPGETIKFAVVFAPMQHAVANATVVITSDDPQSPTTNINLRGTGTQPRISVTPMSLDFGVTIAGISTDSQNITIANTGDDTISIENVAVNGPASSSFKVEGWNGLTTIRSGEQIIVGVRFQPIAAGGLQATLSVTPQGNVLAPVAVGLKGSAVSTAVSVAPMTGDFGLISVGSTSDPLEFTIQNTSGGTLAMAPPTSSNPNFVIDSNDTNLTLGPGARTTFKVSFAPETAQPEMGVIQFFLVAAPKTPIGKITVIGEGVAPVIVDKKSGCSVGRGAPLGGTPALLLVASALLLGVRRRRRTA